MQIKLLRDLWRQRIPCLAIALIVACGVASQVTSFSLIETLTSGMQNYYETSRFSDLFAQTNPVSWSQLEPVRKISQVSGVQPRLVERGRIQIPSEPDESISTTLIATPIEFQDAANRLVVRHGAKLSELRGAKVLVSEVFAQARGLKIGDKFKVSVRGHEITVLVAGIAISPEFLFQILEGSGIPDNRRYAVLWMPYEELSRLVGMQGLFNEVLVSATGQGPSGILREQIQNVVGSDRVLSIHDRTQQISHRYTENAINQLYSIAIVPPALFIAVAAFLTYIAVSRLLKTERENIAMQRAFGYSAWDIARHYLLYVSIVVLVGCVAGCCVGAWLADQALGMYREIYRFPSLPLKISLVSLGFSTVSSLLAGWLGGGASIWAAASLPPAMGLRPEPPASFRVSWLDRLASLLSLSSIWRMILRGLGRWKLRTLLGTLGISLGIAVMILGGYTQAAIAYVMDFEFFFTRRYDLMVQFSQDASERAVEEVAKLPGVQRCEPYWVGRCSVRAGYRERTLNLFGLPDSTDALIAPVDREQKPIGLRRGSLAISETLASALKVRNGSEVELDWLNGQNRKASISVEVVVTDYSGLNAYANMHSLQTWLDIPGHCSGALLTVNPDQRDSIVRALHQRPLVQSVVVKNAVLENFKANDSKNLLMFRIFNMLFSTVIGVGAVYSIATISMMERQKDLALMRVLGYTNQETGSVLIGELCVMLILAIPIGCLSGYGFASIATWILNTETQRIPLLVSPTTYISAILVSFLSFVASAWAVRRTIRQIEYLSLLKSKD